MPLLAVLPIDRTASGWGRHVTKHGVVLRKQTNRSLPPHPLRPSKKPSGLRRLFLAFPEAPWVSPRSSALHLIPCQDARNAGAVSRKKDSMIQGGFDDRSDRWTSPAKRSLRHSKPGFPGSPFPLRRPCGNFSSGFMRVGRPRISRAWSPRRVNLTRYLAQGTDSTQFLHFDQF